MRLCARRARKLGRLARYHASCTFEPHGTPTSAAANVAQRHGGSRSTARHTVGTKNSSCALAPRISARATWVARRPRMRQAYSGTLA